jgi:pre-mRNA-splicing factor SPF27
MRPLDSERYRLDPPAQRNDLAAWRKALDNAHSQLEHQHLRVLNQELMLKHGDKVWRVQVAADEAAAKGLEAQLAGVKRDIDAINQQRKLSQHAAGERGGPRPAAPTRRALRMVGFAERPPLARRARACTAARAPL